MKSELTAKCDLLAANYETTWKSAKLDYVQAAALGALIYTEKNTAACEEDIRKNRKLLSDKVGVFSHLHGYTNVALLCKMSLAKDAGAYLDKVVAAYDSLKRGILHSEYEALAASTFADFAEPAQYEQLGQKTIEVLDKMHALHPMLTGREDTTVAALLALSGLDIDAALAESEACYEALSKEVRFSKDSLQSVSMILALSGKPAAEKCERFSAIRGALKDTKSAFMPAQLPILAALVDTEVSPEEIANDIDEAARYLKKKSGFGDWFGVGYKMRTTLAAALVMQTYREKNSAASMTAAVNSAVAGVLTEQIIMAIVMMMITIAVVANSSHNK